MTPHLRAINTELKTKIKNITFVQYYITKMEPQISHHPPPAIPNRKLNITKPLYFITKTPIAM